MWKHLFDMEDQLSVVESEKRQRREFLSIQEFFAGKSQNGREGVYNYF